MKSITLCLFAVLSLTASAGGEIVVAADSPIRTLEAAVAAVRAERAAGKTGPATILVKPGRYAHLAPLALTAADSQLTIRAEKPGMAVFDGGEALPPFTAGADGIWRAKVRDGLVFSQLYVNGVRAVRARSPNKFYYYITAPVEDELDDKDRPKGLPYRAFFAEAADIAPLKAMAKDELDRVDVIFWQSWDQGFAHIESVDAGQNLVTMRSGAARPLFAWNKYLPRYALENFRAALDAPGEWFHDLKRGELLYIPRAGEKVETARATVPVTPRFVTIAGDRAPGKAAKDIVFENLTFEYSSWLMPEGGVRNGQAAATVHDAGFDVSYAENVEVRACTFRHVGLHGVWFGEGCHHSSIRHSLVEDLGAGGVYVGTPWRGGQAAKLPPVDFITVDDCIIRHGGFELNAGIGLWSGHAADSTYTHNEIADFRYSGVSMGWVWGYAPSVSQRNFLGFNHIHHIGQGVLSDMGGVYTLGDSRGTVVTGNYIHDVNGYAGCGSPAWGLYTDEGSRGIVFSSNVVERVRDGAVHQHYGQENVFTHNVFVGGDNAVWLSRLEDHHMLTVTNNIICWSAPAPGSVFWHHRGGKPCAVKNFLLDSNLYWMPGGFGTNAFNHGAWKTWRAAGMDANSKIAEPRFRDPARGDWHLTEDSPECGFGGTDVSAAGVRKDDAAWRALAEGTVCPELEDAPPAPLYVRNSYRNDFENRPLGPGASRAGMFQMSKEAERGVRVVKGGARTGARCLEITDDGKFKRAYDPHFYISLKGTNGVKMIRCSLQGEAATKMTVELRDYGEAGKYATGPEVSFFNGTLSAHGRRMGADGKAVRVCEPLVKVAPGKWVDVEIELALSGPDAGSWVCRAAVPGGERKVSSRLSGRSEDFRELDWVGFISPGNGVYTWRLDDFEVTDAAAKPVAGVVEAAKAIPVTAEVDVLVVGGTSAGVAAALEAKRAGASVYLAGGAPYLGEDVAGTLELGFGEKCTTASDEILRRLRNESTPLADYGYHFGRGQKAIGGWQYRNDHGSKFQTHSMPVNPGDSALLKGNITVNCEFAGLRRIREIRVVMIENLDPKRDAFKSVDHRQAIKPKEGTGPLTGGVKVTIRDGKDRGRVLELKREAKEVFLSGSAVRAGEPVPHETEGMQGNKYVVFSLPVELEFGHASVECHAAEGAVCQLLSRIHFVLAEAAESEEEPSPLKVKKTFDSLLVENGIGFLTGAPVTDVVTDGSGEVAGAVFANRSGRQAVIAKSVVDATRYGMFTRLGRPLPGIAGKTKFTRVVIDEAEPADVKHEYLREWNILGYRRIGRAYRCELELEMKDGSDASFAAAELAARDLTRTDTTMDDSDRLHLVNIPPPPARRYVRSSVDSGTLVEKLARGRRLGAEAAAEAKARGAVTAARVESAAANPPTLNIEVKEPLGGLRPYDRYLVRRTIAEAARELPSMGEYDVVVVGGGTAGAPAATAAARAGAKTLLVEYLYVIGGVSSEGMITGYYCGNQCGFTKEFNDRTRASRARYGNLKNDNVFTALCREAGAEILFGAFGEGALVENGKVVGVVVVTQQGRFIVRAKTVIDATGDSDIAAAAGSETEFITAGDFALQSAGQAPHRLGKGGANSDFNLVNDPCAWDLWAFGVRSRAGQPDSWDVSQVVDSRERRRIVPDYRLEGWDVNLNRAFHDTVVQALSNQDSHGFLKDEYGYIAEPKKNPQERAFASNVPLRSYLPRGLTGIAVVGVGKGVSRDAVPMTRMRADLQNEGYSLGLAAVQALRHHGGDFRKINVKELQRALVEKGILREEVLAWQKDEEVDDVAFSAAMASIGDGLRGSGLAMAYPWRAIPILREQLANAKTLPEKQAYALVLGVLGDAAGAETLADIVDGRRKCQIDRKGVRYSGSLAEIGLAVALGRTKADCAVEPIGRAVERLSGDSSVGQFRRACLAAEAHGSPKLAPELAKLLGKPGVGGWARTRFEELGPTGGYGLGPETDLCIRELTVARALLKCGDFEGLGRATLEKYARDPRGVFAEHANRVLAAAAVPKPEPARH